MCSASEAGSYLRLVDFVCHSTLGLRVIKKKKKPEAVRRCSADLVAQEWCEMALDLTLRKDKGRVEQTVQMAKGSERFATFPPQPSLLLYYSQA